MTRFIQVALASAVLGALAFPAQAAQRVFVASYGSDANAGAGCLLNAPCRGFTAALGAADAGGEIVALDAAGYGAVTITKSVTLTANPGFYAGIAASSGNAVTIATAGVEVILRGLNLNGVGASNGVVMTDGSRLSIENCVISNFASSGVVVSTVAEVRVVDSLFRDNFVGVRLSGGATSSVSGSKFFGHGQSGVFVINNIADTTTIAAISDSIASYNHVGFHSNSTNATGIARMSVTRSTSSNNNFGVVSEGGTVALVTTSNSMVTGNAASGLYQAGASTHESLGNNTVRQNAINTSGTITAVGGM